MRRVAPRAGWLMVVALLLAGSACFWNRPRPEYEYRQGVLYPPGRADEDVATRMPGKPSRPVKPTDIEIRLANAAPCRTLAASFSAPAVGLEWSLARSRLRIQTEPVLSRMRGNLPVMLLKDIQQLRDTLTTAFDQGCLAPAREQAALTALAQSLPLSPRLAQSILLGPYATQMYLDVVDPVELQLTYALHRNQPGRYDLGYVAQTYRVTDVASDGRGRLRLAAIEVKSAPPGSKPIAPPVALTGGTGPSLYRLFFYLRRSPTDHDVAMLAAKDRTALDAATRALLSGPNRCDSLAIAGARCILMPRDVGLEARLRVRIEDRWTTVPITASVDEALAEAGVRDSARVLPTLRVLRPYRRGYVPVVADGPSSSLLLLRLCGGERISW